MAKEFKVGDRVRLIAAPPYIKTADPMPMLRSADVVAVGEEGIVLDRRPSNYWSVRFSRGAYLIDTQYLDGVNPSES
jgi:Protein of unknown function (DUF3148)